MTTDPIAELRRRGLRGEHAMSARREYDAIADEINLSRGVYDESAIGVAVHELGRALLSALDRIGDQLERIAVALDGES